MLPRGKIHIQLYELIRPQNNGKGFVLEFEGTKFVPDKAYSYLLIHDQSSFASDKLIVDVSPDGLLEAIKLTTEDVTDQVVIKIAGLAGRVLGGATDFTPSFAFIQDKKKYNLVYDAEFDPFSNELKNINQAIFNLAPESKLTIHVEGTNTSEGAPKADVCNSSVCYRPPVSIPIVFKKGDGEIYRKNVIVPDIRSIKGLNLERVTFAETITNVDFEKGMLKQFDVTRPSTALAVAELPLELLKPLIAIPTELIQLKIDTSGKNKNLYDAQRKEIEAQAELIKKLEELRRKKDPSPF